MNLGNTEGISEGMLCNDDDDAANSQAADVFWNSSPLIQLKAVQGTVWGSA